MEAIAKGLYTSRSVSNDNHWTICPDFYTSVALNPLLLLYKEPIPILATFSAKYRRGNISASGKNFRSRTVEEFVRSIGQVPAAMGAK